MQPARVSKQDTTCSWQSVSQELAGVGLQDCELSARLRKAFPLGCGVWANMPAIPRPLPHDTLCRLCCHAGVHFGSPATWPAGRFPARLDSFLSGHAHRLLGQHSRPARPQLHAGRNHPAALRAGPRPHGPNAPGARSMANGWPARRYGSLRTFSAAAIQTRRTTAFTC